MAYDAMRLDGFVDETGNKAETIHIRWQSEHDEREARASETMAKCRDGQNTK